jgi:20S proteasome alpha/beta subunit
MIIQTPESVIYKKFDAEERIDSYLLISLVYKNGLVFGIKFNERQNEKCQWMIEINPAVFLAGIGDLQDFEACELAVGDFCQNIKNILAKHYITGNGIEKFLSKFLRENFDEGLTALAVNFIIADRRKNEPSLWFIDFGGEVKKLKNFAVAGGCRYEELISEKEVGKLTPEQKDFLEKQKKILENQKNNFKKDESAPEFDISAPVRIRNPRKEAIAYLEKYWKPAMNKKEVIELIKNVLFGFNPESKDKTIEIVVIEKNKKDRELLHFKEKK